MDPAQPRGPRRGRVGHGVAAAAPRDLGQPPIVLNRRAATRPTITGVERWTDEVIGRLKVAAPDRYIVAQPPPRARRRLVAQSWEQVALPAQAARARAALVFSPANLAPLVWPRNVVVMHDAAVLREPEAYSRAYRAWHQTVGLGCARRAMAVLTVSEFSRRELIERAGLDPSRLTVIPGGVAERFTPSADRAGVARKLGLERPYVLTIATADARKNLGSLTRAAEALAERGIELVWAGDRRPYFARAAAPARLRPLGYVDEEDLPGLYGGALAYVLPSRYEGFGLTCLEAMACGTPVIAADRAALPETCGEAAILVDPDDTASLADAIIAATEPGARETLRTAGLRRAAQFTWDRAAASTDALLSELARG